MGETILVLNSGSSSIKFQLYAVCAGNRLERRMKGLIDGIGVQPRFRAADSKGDGLVDQTWPAADVRTVPAALDKLVVFLRDWMSGSLPRAVGHRVVHGGPTFTTPTVVTRGVLD